MIDERERIERVVLGFTPPDDAFARLVDRRHRKQRNQRLAAGVVGVTVALAVAAVLVRAISSESVPANPEPTIETPTFDRTATIGGAVEVSSPGDWFLVDHWPATDSEVHLPWEEPRVMFEVANFDPGLSEAICPAEPGRSRSLPVDGIAVSVTFGPASDVRARCAGAIEDVRTGTIPMYTYSIPYTSVMVAGPDASDRDRATAAAIIDSIEPTGSFGWIRHGGGHPAYVLDAWTDGAMTPTFEARPSKGNVVHSVIEIQDSEGNVGGDSVEVSGSQPVETIDGGVASFGSVTGEVDRVELHLPGVDEPFVAKRIALPPSLNAGFDAFVFEPQPKDGPYEVVAYGTDGEVLYSSLPPLTDTVRVGTVRAFGTTWAVKLSTAADGYWGASCVEPAATSTLEPCERAWGDGSLVQTFEKPVPAVFVTVTQGVEEVDVITDEGRRYPSVMIPTDHGGSIAVVALEGAGEGRFVYRWDGKVHRGRKTLRWTDVGQVIGNFSEMPG